MFSTGDVHWLKKAEQRMQSLIDRARIFMLVSHSMEQIAKHCNRVVWMQHGGIVADGPPAEVLPRYVSSGGAEARLADAPEHSTVEGQ